MLFSKQKEFLNVTYKFFSSFEVDFEKIFLFFKVTFHSKLSLYTKVVGIHLEQETLLMEHYQ